MWFVVVIVSLTPDGVSACEVGRYGSSSEGCSIVGIPGGGVNVDCRCWKIASTDVEAVASGSRALEALEQDDTGTHQLDPGLQLDRYDKNSPASIHLVGSSLTA